MQQVLKMSKGQEELTRQLESLQKEQRETKAKQMKSALEKGAWVLHEEEHELIMEELHARDMGEEE